MKERFSEKKIISVKQELPYPHYDVDQSPEAEGRMKKRIARTFDGYILKGGSLDVLTGNAAPEQENRKERDIESGSFIPALKGNNMDHFRRAIQEDTLTRALIRKAFLAQGASRVRDIVLTQPKAQALFVSYVDANYFKILNSLGGDQLGDIVVKAILDMEKKTSRLPSTQGKNIGRHGGEESAVFLTAEARDDLEERIMNHVQQYQERVRTLLNTFYIHLIGESTDGGKEKGFDFYQAYEQKIIEERNVDYNARIDQDEFASFQSKLCASPSAPLKCYEWKASELITHTQDVSTEVKNEERDDFDRFIFLYNAVGAGVKDNPEMLLNALSLVSQKHPEVIGISREEVGAFIKQNPKLTYEQILAFLEEKDPSGILKEAVDLHPTIGTVSIGVAVHRFDEPSANTLDRIPGIHFKLENIINESMHDEEQVKIKKSLISWIHKQNYETTTLHDVLQYIEELKERENTDAAIFDRIQTEISGVWFEWIVEHAGLEEKSSKKKGDTQYYDTADLKETSARMALNFSEEAYHQISPFMEQFDTWMNDPESDVPNSLASLIQNDDGTRLVFREMMQEMTQEDFKDFPLFQNVTVESERTQLVEQFLYDSVSGVYDRKMIEVLEEIWFLEGSVGSCVFGAIDFDRLKASNDTLGDTAGDAAIKMASQIMTVGLYQHSNGKARFVRKGGEEMIFLWPDVSAEEVATAVEKIQGVVIETLQQFYESIEFPGTEVQNGKAAIKKYNHVHYNDTDTRPGSFTAALGEYDVTDDYQKGELFTILRLVEDARDLTKRVSGRGVVANIMKLAA